MVTVITASEARTISTSINSDVAEKQLTRIFQEIRSAAARGDNKVSISLYVTPVVEAELRRLGYIVNGYTVKKWDDQRDGTYTQVSW